VKLQPVFGLEGDAAKSYAILFIADLGRGFRPLAVSF
jgi:hypothetical protein